MSFIWVTRGRSWGFRFLRDGGFENPLTVYESAFSGIGDEEELCHRVGEKVVLRFPDPEGRRDRAGRTIPHEFVVLGRLADEISSLSAGRLLVWPQVADQFAGDWSHPFPPPPAG